MFKKKKSGKEQWTGKNDCGTLLHHNSTEFNNSSIQFNQQFIPNITIGRNKFQIVATVKFAGHIILSEGVTPDPERLKAILEFKTPSCTKDIQGFLGLASQLVCFNPDLSHMTAGMRNLLKKGVAFQWLAEHEEEFQRVKQLLTSPAVIGFFDSDRPTELLTDASKTRGLGYALIQTDSRGVKKLIQFGSRTLTPSEEKLGNFRAGRESHWLRHD